MVPVGARGRRGSIVIAARVTSIELHSERVQSMDIGVRSPSDRPDLPAESLLIYRACNHR